jgi:hypothetical protein
LSRTVNEVSSASVAQLAGRFAGNRLDMEFPKVASKSNQIHDVVGNLAACVRRNHGTIAIGFHAYDSKYIVWVIVHDSTFSAASIV